MPPPQRSGSATGSNDLLVYQVWKGSNVSPYFTFFLFILVLLLFVEFVGHNWISVPNFSAFVSIVAFLLCVLHSSAKILTDTVFLPK